LLSNKSGYDDLQKTLDNLIVGTKEWKEALYESNEEVLNLINKFPKLAEFLERDSTGRLTIKDEGWDALMDQQNKTIANTTASVSQNRVQEGRL
jgi:hypothetical protein